MDVISKIKIPNELWKEDTDTSQNFMQNSMNYLLSGSSLFLSFSYKALSKKIDNPVRFK